MQAADISVRASGSCVGPFITVFGVLYSGFLFLKKGIHKLSGKAARLGTLTTRRSFGRRVSSYSILG